jgi:SAM-dependent methyltransferase
MRPDYQRLAASLMRLAPFESVVDVGCANGFLLESFAEADRTISGIELSPAVVELLDPSIRDVVQIGDFSALDGMWDLVCCVEVAEHIPPERSLDLVETLTRAARGWIYFTAAPPGQGGHGHINCRPHAEWMAEFDERGWQVDEQRTRELRQDLERLERAAWLRGNSFLLAPKGDAAEATPPAQ